MLQFFCGAGSPASAGPMSGHGARTCPLAMVVDIHDVGCRSGRGRGRGGGAGSSDSAGNISGRGGRTRPLALVVDIHDVDYSLTVEFGELLSFCPNYSL